MLFADWLYYRVSGDTRERPLGNYTKSDGGLNTLAGVALANVMTFTFTETGAAGGVRFSGSYVRTLTEPAAGQANLANTVTLNNPNQVPLSMSLYHYADFDIPTSAGTNTAAGGIGGITITGISSFATHVPVSAATGFQVGAFSTIRALLLDANVNNLNNLGLPFGPGDYTGAFQWDVTIPALGSVVVDFSMAINPVAVPEPATLALVGFSALFVGEGVRRWRARRQKNRFVRSPSR